MSPGPRTFHLALLVVVVLLFHTAIAFQPFPLCAFLASFLDSNRLRLAGRVRGAMERPDSLDTSDVAGAKSRPLPTRHTAHPFNTNIDIERSRPLHIRATTDFMTHPRSTNPLTPDYRTSGFEYQAPPPQPPPRDIMWTLPQKKWKPAPRDPYSFPPSEVYSRNKLYLQNCQQRNSIHVEDITGPQTRIEEPRWRKTDPLMPVYKYDGAVVEEVPTRRRRYGSNYPRRPCDAFALRTDDIVTAETISCREYPKELIKTRAANRTDDIEGAQAGTKAIGPKLWRTRDPSHSIEKLMSNHVFDIDGAVAGTAGQGIKCYRARNQAEKVEKASAPLRAHLANAPSRSTHSAPALKGAAERKADIEAVRGLW